MKSAADKEQLLGQRAHRELLQQREERAVHGTKYHIREDAKAEIFEYVEVFYNRSRRHSTPGLRSPI